MLEEPQEPTIERTDAPLIHDRTGAVIGVLRNDVRNEATATAEAAAPLPANYREVTPEIMANCSPEDLVRYSMQAQDAKDWQAVVALQDALTKLQPGDARAHLILSVALERIGRYADAFVVWGHAVTLENYEPDPRDAMRSARLREKMTGARSASAQGVRPVRYDLPSSHLNVTQEMLTLCTPCDLVRYSTQAQKDERWDRVEIFQRELVKQQPQNIVAHIRLARAFVKQEKTEDAAGLMTTIEKLRTFRNNAKVIHAILGLKRRLDEAAAKTHARRPAENPAPHPRPDPAPTSRKLSNIDTSRFDNFLASIQREGGNWQFVQGRGEGWRKIPEEERDFFIEVFAEFKKQLARVIEKGPHRAFWGKFDDMESQFCRGSFNIHALVTLMERAQNATSGAKVDFGRLEPIRLKVRSAGPERL